MAVSFNSFFNFLYIKKEGEFLKNTETLKLDDIATISTGVVVSRKKADFSPVKTYKMLTLKSFEESGWINKKELDKFDSSEVLSEQYLTQNGDVVIRLSSPNTTIYIEQEESGLVITSLFAVISIYFFQNVQQNLYCCIVTLG